ncbi:MAG: protein-disulfide reductase [Comamonadaceae bacterium]|nr:MAG: protein-disulfide reductase [Comamonadaceae bacterium]
MTLSRALLSACAVLAATTAFGPQALAQLSPGLQSVVTTPHVRAELVAQAPQGVGAGLPLWLGLRLAHQPEWHTYWKNAGDSGLPTELQWTLPAGLSAGEIAWPVPRKIPIGNLANYGYENTVLLPVPVTVEPSFRAGAGDVLAGIGTADTVEIRLKASWLVCRKECIPEEGSFALRLPVRGSTALHRAEFDAAAASQPAALPAGGTAAVAIDGPSIEVSVDGLPAAAKGRTLEFFPETGDVIRTGAVSGKDWTQRWDGERWLARIPLADQRGASPATMPVVLALAEADRRPGQPIGWRVEAPVAGEWPQAPARAEVSPALAAALSANAAGGTTAAAGGASGAGAADLPLHPIGMASFAIALLAALLGGLLLNLMPCVFPILAIKVLSFARQAGDQGAHRRAGLAYAAGVVLSFLLLGGAMLALRAAGTQLGWGFQLQSPGVVAALAALFTLIGLNLAGVFEFGRMAPSRVCTAQVRHPMANDFLSGVLAVVIASPCTAPFMGASLGLAIGLPAVQALPLFAALGLGLALPYLAAGFVPALARMLPQPGPWMNTLRRLLAFPIFATVAWLVWVLGQQSGIDGAGALLGLLVCLSAVVWAFTLHGRTRWVLAALLMTVTAALAAAIGPSLWQPAGATAAAAPARADGRWEPWSAERAAQLASEGRPVFIDFTAAWCVTCQYNKKAVLADAEILADLDARRIVTLRADWTRRDPAITTALAALGRNGVPVYVLQAPGRPAVVLTEVLRKGEVRSAIAAL